MSELVIHLFAHCRYPKWIYILSPPERERKRKEKKNRVRIAQNKCHLTFL
jgi:hypothetical protein